MFRVSAAAVFDVNLWKSPPSRGRPVSAMLQLWTLAAVVRMLPSHFGTSHFAFADWMQCYQSVKIHYFRCVCVLCVGCALKTPHNCGDRLLLAHALSAPAFHKHAAHVLGTSGGPAPWCFRAICGIARALV